MNRYLVKPLESFIKAIIAYTGFRKNLSSSEATDLETCHLSQVAEALAQLQLLVSGVHSIRLSLVQSFLALQLLVEPGKHELEAIAADNGDTKHGSGDAIAGTVVVCLVEPDVGARNVSDLTESVDHGNRDGTLRRRTRERG